MGNIWKRRNGQCNSLHRIQLQYFRASQQRIGILVNLARNLLREQEVAGSNPAAPIIKSHYAARVYADARPLTQEVGHLSSIRIASTRGSRFATDNPPNRVSAIVTCTRTKGWDFGPICKRCTNPTRDHDSPPSTRRAFRTHACACGEKQRFCGGTGPRSRAWRVRRNAYAWKYRSLIYDRRRRAHGQSYSWRRAMPAVARGGRSRREVTICRWRAELRVRQAKFIWEFQIWFSLPATSSSRRLASALARRRK